MTSPGSTPPQSTPPALRLVDVVAGYGATVVLDRLSLDVPATGALAILGRNGVGKTTLLATIMGHTTLHAGTLALGDLALHRLTPHRRARAGLGWVPQEREIFPSLSVEENLAVVRRPNGGRWTIERVFDLFPSLGSRRRNFGNHLSGGEQQMLSIGRALMSDPRILLMDEPLEGLAPVIVDAVYAAMQRLQAEAGLAIVLVEQHARRALDFAERTVILDRGRITYQGASRSLRDNPADLAALIGVGGGHG